MAIRKHKETEMVDTERLKSLINQSGIRKELIAGKCGMSISSLNNKLAQRTDFCIEEAVSICDLLQIDKPTLLEIFFKDEVGKMPTDGRFAG